VKDVDTDKEIPDTWMVPEEKIIDYRKYANYSTKHFNKYDQIYSLYRFDDNELSTEFYKAEIIKVGKVNIYNYIFIIESI